ncbi:hypothetical protein EDD16DRAFT_1892774 [Pisolithus croceorrhizus]|nr:hypothetical protein EDD16DRAFT_1892774 [Pisolithus croceorrhizus]KAI6150050.1 hypothetical protein EDD17DRAFT_1878676 [Pisolithus thermaeus]
MLSDWRVCAYKLKPNIVFAASDKPFTTPLYSQKRVTKSAERSISWLADMLRPLKCSHLSQRPSIPGGLFQHPLSVFVNTTVGTSIPAREAFAQSSLCKELYGPNLEAVKPIKPLDDGVVGYSFHLMAREARSRNPTPKPTERRVPAGVTQYAAKYREANRSSNAKGREVRIPSPLLSGVRSPHEMLKLIRDVGADIFDAGLAIAPANIGIALDFVFPLAPDQRFSEGGKGKDVWHNLYDHGLWASVWKMVRLSDLATESQSQFPAPLLICQRIACSPRSPASHIRNGKPEIFAPFGADVGTYGASGTQPRGIGSVSGVWDLLLGGDANDTHR